MSQLKRTNPDGSYTPLATMSKAEWDQMGSTPMSSWAKRVGRRQITVNSQPRIILRGHELKQATKRTIVRKSV